MNKEVENGFREYIKHNQFIEFRFINFFSQNSHTCKELGTKYYLHCENHILFAIPKTHKFGEKLGLFYECFGRQNIEIVKVDENKHVEFYIIYVQENQVPRFVTGDLLCFLIKSICLNQDYKNYFYFLRYTNSLFAIFFYNYILENYQKIKEDKEFLSMFEGQNFGSGLFSFFSIKAKGDNPFSRFFFKNIFIHNNLYICSKDVMSEEQKVEIIQLLFNQYSVFGFAKLVSDVKMGIYPFLQLSKIKFVNKLEDKKWNIGRVIYGDKCLDLYY